MWITKEVYRPPLCTVSKFSLLHMQIAQGFVPKADLARQRYPYLDRDLSFILRQMGGQEPVTGQRAGHVEDPGGAVRQCPRQGDCEGGGHDGVTRESRLQRVDHRRRPRSEVTAKTERKHTPIKKLKLTYLKLCNWDDGLSFRKGRGKISHGSSRCSIISAWVLRNHDFAFLILEAINQTGDKHRTINFMYERERLTGGPLPSIKILKMFYFFFPLQRGNGKCVLWLTLNYSSDDSKQMLWC